MDQLNFFDIIYPSDFPCDNCIYEDFGCTYDDFDDYCVEGDKQIPIK